jgi:hypothetical protein
MNCACEIPLEQVAEEVFASMAFLFPAAAEDCPAGERDAESCASVAFAGSVCGRLVLRVPEAIVPSMAANMLGCPDPDAVSAEQQRDALGEMANVICGNLLPRLTSPRDIYHVAQPAFGPPPEEPRRPACEARVCLEAGAVSLQLYLDQPGDAPA